MFVMDTTGFSDALSAYWTSPDISGIVPAIARFVQNLVGEQGLVFRVGPTMLLCAIFTHQPADPEMICGMVLRAMSRAMAVSLDSNPGLLSYYVFETESPESKAGLINFLLAI
jgi:hypothetical protein